MVRAYKTWSIQNGNTVWVHPVFIFSSRAAMLNHRLLGGLDFVVETGLNIMQPKIIPLLIGMDAFLDKLETAILPLIKAHADLGPGGLNYRDKFRHGALAIVSW